MKGGHESGPLVLRASNQKLYEHTSLLQRRVSDLLLSQCLQLVQYKVYCPANQGFTRMFFHRTFPLDPL
jgi:hypothetical protein